ncbi:MAG: alpha-ribazole phosphatase family protein [Methyloprofundus sp.]|nr:alpha-ribazole phosphatase family protein [Methyloprofundus sp.]
MSSSLVTTISLFRHGAVEGGACYRGITDDPLSTEGWQQMQQAINTASPNSRDIIISSPLLRCYTFAKDLSQRLNLPLISNSEFQEINFGDWEGKTAEQIDSHALSQFYLDPSNNKPPNGESFILFQARILLAWQQLIERYQGKHILLVSHGGVIRVILANILGLDIAHSFKLKIGYACLSHVECFHSSDSDDFFQLIKHG